MKTGEVTPKICHDHSDYNQPSSPQFTQSDENVDFSLKLYVKTKGLKIQNPIAHINILTSHYYYSISKSNRNVDVSKGETRLNAQFPFSALVMYTKHLHLSLASLPRI